MISIVSQLLECPSARHGSQLTALCRCNVQYVRGKIKRTSFTFLDAMWAASIVEALNPDPLVRTRLVGYHAGVGRLVALIMLTHVSRLLQGRELPESGVYSRRFCLVI